MAERVGLSAEHLKRRPHELSGGQRQRAYIAMVIAQDTEFILLDEPTNSSGWRNDLLAGRVSAGIPWNGHYGHT